MFGVMNLYLTSLMHNHIIDQMYKKSDKKQININKIHIYNIIAA